MLRFGRRSYGVLSRGEGNEERIALCIHLVTPVGVEACAKKASVVSEQIRIGVAGTLQQLGRALDVGEKKGDSPAGRISHACHVRTHGLLRGGPQSSTFRQLSSRAA